VEVLCQVIPGAPSGARSTIPKTAVKLLREKNVELINCISDKLCLFCISISILWETHWCLDYVFLPQFITVLCCKYPQNIHCHFTRTATPAVKAWLMWLEINVQSTQTTGLKLEKEQIVFQHKVFDTEYWHKMTCISVPVT